MNRLLFQSISYLKFFLKSGNAHGLHSPFVFDIYTKAIQDKSQSKELEFIEKIRFDFLMNKETINIKDYGAGSRVSSSIQKKISQIALYSLSTPKKCLLLYHIIKYLEPKSILELGTSLGISTHYINEAAKKAKIVSVEGDPEIHKLAKKHLPENIHLVNDVFDNCLNNILRDFKTLDFAYLDGNHQYSPTLKYVEQIKPFLLDESCIILDDIYWSPDMAKAWKEIQKDEFFGISIDLFHFGLVFPRQKQPKQHFTLRI